MAAQPAGPKFPLGRLVTTPQALASLNPEDVQTAISRHNAGDWGDLGEDDVEGNWCALDEGLRLMSVYQDRVGIKFWIITEADRSVTTAPLPEEY